MSGSGYESAPATAMLATNCACCGRALLDATSVETGIGPECRRKHGYGDAQGEPSWESVMVLLDGLVAVAEVNPTMEPRAASNRLVHRFACEPNVDARVALTAAIAALGFSKLATKLAEHAGGKVEITPRDDGRVGVKTPYRPEFVAELKAARVGARWDGARKVWTVPTDSRAKAGLWTVLRRTFPGALLVSERGTSTIPAAA